MNVVVLAEVIATRGLTTLNVNLSLAGWPKPLEAVKVIGKLPLCVGVPESTPPTNFTPLGRVPVSEIVRVGVPVAFTVKDPWEPSVNVVELRPVKEGDWPTAMICWT